MSGRLGDAWRRRDAARELLERYDYAGALREAQRCIELSVKAFLDVLGVNYRLRDRIPHDVSDRIPEAFEKVRHYLEDYEVNTVRGDLAKAAVLLKMLTSIRGYLEYGVNDLAGAHETFDYSFAGLSKELVELVGRCFGTISYLVEKISKSEGKTEGDA